MDFPTFTGSNRVAQWPTKGAHASTASDYELAVIAFARIEVSSTYEPAEIAGHAQVLIDAGEAYATTKRTDVILDLRRRGLVTLAARTYCPNPRPFNANRKRLIARKI